MPTIGKSHYLEAQPQSGATRVGHPSASGSGLKGTLVLIHGFPLGPKMWTPQLELADQGWRVIVPHLRGFDGPTADNVVTSVDDFAGDIVDLLDALHIEDAVIGGLSMGGYITFALFRLAPRYFRAMILADTRAQADSPEGIEGRMRMLELVRDHGAEGAAGDMLPKLLSESSLRSKPKLVQEVRSLILSNSPETIAGAIKALMTRPDAMPLLSKIHCPTLILVGDEDTLTPPSFSEDMKRAIQGAELVIVPGAGHMSNMEQPETFNRALARFLEYRV